ncbi:MAG: T9SS type A sorting domain-containing protein, partial [Bacteroidales bacterium]|nr:T9SS type A sorting domain-containing protein [Bacteroidales bacterium]
LLSNDPETGLVVGKRGINVNFHQLSSNTIILGGETVNNYTYIAYVKINLATNLGRIIKKEVKGRAESKQDIFGSIRQSYMNTNPVDMTDLDHMLNIVFHNHWAAIARNEQNVNILDLENTPAFGTPAASNITAPANNASDLEKSVRIQYDNIFGADKYRLQISTMENFSTILKDLDVFRNDTTLALDAHTTYYARVQAINSTGTAPWSSTVKFTTALETSVGDIPESGFRIYPVPAGDRLNIEYISGFSGTRRTYSITGQLLDTKDIIEDTEVIDMTGTAPGIYILEFSDGRTKHYARIVRH